MPEFPDIELYLHALRPADRRAAARSVFAWPARFWCARSIRPSTRLIGRTVRGLRRLGKRIVWEHGRRPVSSFFHLMIAGRFRWKERGPRDPRQGRPGGVRLSRRHAAADRGRVEAAGVAVCGARRGRVDEHDPGGLEVIDVALDALRRRRCGARITRSSAR